MFTSSTFILAAISVFARVAVATPPACLLGAIGSQANPADLKTICGSGLSGVEANITSLCTGDASSQAMSILSSTCLSAGVTISVSSSSASATTTHSSKSGSKSGSGSASATSDSDSTSFTTATATGAKTTGTSTSASASSKGSSTAGTSSSATGAANAGFSTSPEHALYLTPIFFGALAYLL